MRTSKRVAAPLSRASSLLPYVRVYPLFDVIWRREETRRRSHKTSPRRLVVPLGDLHPLWLQCPREPLSYSRHNHQLPKADLGGEVRRKSLLWRQITANRGYVRGGRLTDCLSADRDTAALQLSREVDAVGMKPSTAGVLADVDTAGARARAGWGVGADTRKRPHQASAVPPVPKCSPPPP